MMMEVEDQLRVMLRQESGSYRCLDYLNPDATSTSVPEMDDQDSFAEMNEVWRRKICEWSYKVVDHFGIDREVVGICLNYLDRFLGTQKASLLRSIRTKDERVSAQTNNIWTEEGLIDSKIFQLAAMTSLYVAVKLHAESSDGMMKRKKKLNLGFFVDLSRGQFSALHLLSMERMMLGALLWRMNPSTPMKFVAYFLRLLPGTIDCPEKPDDNDDSMEGGSIIGDERVIHVLYELSRYLAELSVCVYSLSVQHTPSTVAFASILVSMDMIDPRALPLLARDAFFAHAERISCLHPALPEVVDACWQLKTICPDFCDSSASNHAEERSSEVHPIAIARNAGFLVSTTSSSSSSPMERVYQVESPVCVSKHTKGGGYRYTTRRKQSTKL